VYIDENGSIVFRSQRYATTETVPQYVVNNNNDIMIIIIIIVIMIEISYPHDRPWRPIGLLDVKDPTLRQSAHRWRKNLSPTH
jgi:hypothetical protein